MLARFVNSLPNGLAQQITRLYFRALTLQQSGSHSHPTQVKYTNMDISILPALTDNYMYLIVDKATKQAMVVDPVQPNTVMEAVQYSAATLTTVLTTHHHWDHAGGNEALKQLMPKLKIYGGDSRITGITNLVDHNDVIKVGNLTVRCLYTPCHTTGHMCYYIEASGDEKAVFTGDTLFLGGCGRFFEGTADQMYKALITILSSLPDDTKVYCGHEYSIQNLKFASIVEPLNEALAKKLEWSIDQRNIGLPTVPSTIGEEKSYNPFMRVLESTVRQFVGLTDPIKTMQMIRQQKDNFKP